MSTAIHTYVHRYVVPTVMLCTYVCTQVQTRVARWFVFKPKIPVWVNFGGPQNEKSFNIFDHLEYFTAIWYNLLPFGIFCGRLVYVFFPYWYVWPKKNLATLIQTSHMYCQLFNCRPTITHDHWPIL
jgi:hypothetical protein